MDISNIILDELFFIGDPEAFELQNELREAAEGFGIAVTFTEFPQSNPHKRAEAIAIAGLAISAVATTISLLSYIHAKKRKLTVKSIHDEINAYLALKGINDYRVVSSSGLDSLLAGSEVPGKITFAYPNGDEGSVVFGIRDNHIWVTSAQPSVWRHSSHS